MPDVRHSVLREEEAEEMSSIASDTEQSARPGQGNDISVDVSPISPSQTESETDDVFKNKELVAMAS